MNENGEKSVSEYVVCVFIRQKKILGKSEESKK